ncbi:MAG: radical SAM family heme chaperone HemW [Clostridiales Family XIII bacterium]|jgi:oxygen-independent coproporphyrinogen-3 oxidase|nr:radical SAM family heme chaperone HemW [Clostridiales Family XIII bacterium]
MSDLGIYIHLPFCKRKCDYCSFFSLSNFCESDIKKYIENLCLEINNTFSNNDFNIKSKTIDSIYFGGGTPSLINEKYIGKILDCFDIAEKDIEITIEGNPESLGKEKLKYYKTVGINRLSIGIQSLNDNMLSILGRIHNSSQAISAYNNARNAGFENISIDLIFGIPGQTYDILKNEIEKVLLLNPEHISYYSLEIEKDLPLYNNILKGNLIEIPDEKNRKMYWEIIKSLKENGYEQYEISNFAKKRKSSTNHIFSSRHNLKYWTGKDYFGFGIAAHSYLKKENGSSFSIRLENIHCKNQELSYKRVKYYLSEKDDMKEYIFMGLRKNEGINFSDFQNRYGENIEKFYKNEIINLLERDLIEKSKKNKLNEKIFLTKRGFDFANEVFLEFL